MPKKFTLCSAFVTTRRILSLPICGIACSILTGTLLVFSPSISLSKPSKRTLTFAERVSYQRAIEEVYWRHRLWSTSTASIKPPLDKVMSQAEIAKKVEDYMRDSHALEDYWQKPITPDQLQAEMERIATHTKQPGVLREIFAALGNDAFVIAECLTRPVLTERLLGNLSAPDNKVRFDSARSKRQHSLRSFRWRFGMEESQQCSRDHRADCC